MVETLAERIGYGITSTSVHYLAQPEYLGIITWHLHGTSLAVCAKTWLFQGLA